MIGLYFSGTGNTRYCVRQFVSQVSKNASCVSIEDPEILSYLEKEEEIIFGYPVYFSNIPMIVRDFIEENQKIFRHKKIFIITTMGLFSGDGAGCSARMFKRYGAEITGGLHLTMPDIVSDCALLKKNQDKQKQLIHKASQKIAAASQRFCEGRPSQDGLGFVSHAAGLLGQRLWFYSKTNSYKDKPQVKKEACTGCGKCVSLCPTANLTFRQGQIQNRKKCTLCYRCVNSCPSQALTILGTKVYDQHLLGQKINPLER